MLTRDLAVSAIPVIDNRDGFLHNHKRLELGDIFMMIEDIRILIVDDDPAVRDILLRLCEIRGYEPVCAGSAPDALRLLGQGLSYHLVIVDFLMPEMHGVDFIREVRASRPNIPIIATSAWNSVQQPFMIAGANLFLSKPFDLHVLAHEIEMIVGSA